MSKKTNTIISILIAIITLVLIVIIIVAAVKNGRQPENPVEPSTAITTPTEKPDDSKPGTGDVHIDVEQPVDGSRDDKPGIDGDVAVIPGVKEDTE